MSRPCSSVPRTCDGEPTGARRSRIAPAFGSWGEIQGASTADRAMSSSRAPATSVARSRESRQATVRQ